MADSNSTNDSSTTESSAFRRVNSINDPLLFYFPKRVLGEMMPLVLQLGQTIQASVSFCDPYKAYMHPAKFTNCKYKYDTIVIDVSFSSIGGIDVHQIQLCIVSRGSILGQDGYSVGRAIIDPDTGESRQPNCEVEQKWMDLMESMSTYRE